MLLFGSYNNNCSNFLFSNYNYLYETDYQFGNIYFYDQKIINNYDFDYNQIQFQNDLIKYINTNNKIKISYDIFLVCGF